MRELTLARWSEIEPLLDALLELPTDQREAALERDCADAELRAAVLTVLALDASAENRVDRLAQDLCATGSGFEGQRIGPYRIERTLGEGGMGTVFLATRQTAEFTQQVALKLLRVGLYSSVQQELFRREQQIHARLEHPYIARVYDSGITAAGVPYFAMEFVDGVPLGDYCDREALGVDARLRLFAAICEAVAYAHQNLVVHRDLKPSNILIGRDGNPRLLDFGIAKLLPGAGAGPEATQTQWRTYTPGYAAPEQVGDGGVTTATDVYALGVILAELLTGARPGRDDAGELSASLTSSVGAAAAVARGTSAKALSRRLRGDLEAIVRKALQADPLRRYPGAAALRDEILRHLAGKPIRAQPDAWLYRTGKFMRRHRIAVAAAAIMTVVLIGATAFSLYQAQVARREAARANSEAARANAVKRFLLDLFESSAPGDPQHVETADAMLAKGLAKARSAFVGQPDLQVDVLRNVGDIQRRRGQYDGARAPLEEAAALAQERFGPGDARTLEAVVALSRLDEAHDAYADAERRLEQAVTAYGSAGGPESTALAHALQQLGVMKLRQHQVQPAVDLEQQALAMYRRLLPDESDDINTAMIGLGDALDHAGKSEQAVTVFRDVVARSRRMYGDAHVLTAQALAFLAAPLRELGEVADAEASLREAVEINRKVYLAPNLNATDTLYELGKTLLAEGKADESETTFREELAIEWQLFPGGHPNIASTMKNIAAARAMAMHYEDAAGLLRESLALDLRLRGEDHPYIAQTRTSLARALIHLGRIDEAAGLLDLALAADRKRFDQSHPAIAADLIGSAELAAARGDAGAALDASEQALTIYAAALPESHSARLDAQLHVAENVLAARRPDQAQLQFAAAAGTARKATPPVAATIVRALLGRARSEIALGRISDAKQTLAEAQRETARLAGDATTTRSDIANLLASLN